MNNPFAIIVFTIAITLFTNCKSYRELSTAPTEAVERVSTFWNLNNSGNSTVAMPEKAWYQDSIGITQICRLMFNETDTSRTVTVVVNRYRFVDLRKKWAYEYATLTDTASILSKYPYNDTTIFSGGWNFANRKPLAVDSYDVLPDTTIGAVSYKRAKVIFDFNKARFEGVGLLRCDKKDTQFKIDVGISNKIGCPLVSFRYYPVTSPQSKFDQEIKFISNDFPDSVRKAFDAWKRNEKTHPVQ